MKIIDGMHREITRICDGELTHQFDAEFARYMETCVKNTVTKLYEQFGKEAVKRYTLEFLKYARALRSPKFHSNPFELILYEFLAQWSKEYGGKGKEYLEKRIVLKEIIREQLTRYPYSRFILKQEHKYEPEFLFPSWFCCTETDEDLQAGASIIKELGISDVRCYAGTVGELQMQNGVTKRIHSIQEAFGDHPDYRVNGHAIESETTNQRIMMTCDQRVAILFSLWYERHSVT